MSKDHFIITVTAYAGESVSAEVLLATTDPEVVKYFQGQAALVKSRTEQPDSLKKLLRPVVEYTGNRKKVFIAAVSEDASEIAQQLKLGDQVPLKTLASVLNRKITSITQSLYTSRARGRADGKGVMSNMAGVTFCYVEDVQAE